MPEELKTCPACGNAVIIEDGEAWHSKNIYLIKCWSCECITVADIIQEKCIARWNALPRHEDFKELVAALKETSSILNTINSKMPGGVYYKKYEPKANDALVKARAVLAQWSYL